MTRVLYVCDSCWENYDDITTYDDPKDLRIGPDDRTYCEVCWDYAPFQDENEEGTGPFLWREAPIPQLLRVGLEPKGCPTPGACSCIHDPTNSPTT